MPDLTHQPRCHLHPSTGWMNDPNGAIQYDGLYHLFYQYNPYGAFSASKHWAHVTSRDMLHWQHWPVALAPEAGSYDRDGCFSGCAVVHEGTPTLIYTGVRPQVQCLATSRDGLHTWERHPANPVLPAPPPGLEVTGFRDPYAFRGEGGQWNLLVGSGIRGAGGTALLYRSADLVHWQYLNPLLVGRADETGRVWNCPAFFPLGEKHVLLVSGQPVWKAFFFSGDFDGRYLLPQTSGLADHGGCLYAPQVFIDERGRALLWGWLWEARPDEEILAAGWAGVMSFPRVLSLNAEGTLASSPAEELEALRGTHLALGARRLPEGEQLIPSPPGGCLELLARFLPGSARRFGLRVFREAGGSTYTGIGFDVQRGEVFIDRSQAGLSPNMAFGWPNPPVHSARLALQAGEALELRIFLDRSVIEAFANRGLAFSSRVYPAQPDECGVSLFCEGGQAELLSLDAWQLALEIGDRS